MKKMNFLIRSILLNLISFAALSATNPIAWTLNRSFETPIITGRADAITYTLTNQLPFQLVKALNITKIASPQSEFSYDDHCSGVRLASKASCTVKIILSPLLPGAKTFQLVIGGYDNNQVKLPELTTIASGSATPSNVVASATGALPYQMQLGVAADYTFTINNYGETEATNVQTTVTQSNGETPNITYNSCTTGTYAHTIPAKGFCTIIGSYLPNTSTPSSQSVSLSATFDGATGSPATALTSTTINNVVEGDILGSLISPFYLPPVMVQNQSYDLEFLFTNVTNHAVNFSGVGVGTVTCVDSHSQNCNNKISNFSSNCNNNLPAPHGNRAKT